MLEFWKFWMSGLMIIATLGLLFLSGCGTYGKKTDVDVDIKYNITTTGTVNISPDFDQKSLTGDISDLKTDNRPDIPVDLQLTKPADILQSAVVGAVDSKIIDTATKIKPEVEPIIQHEPFESNQETFTMQYIPEHHRFFTWLPETGAHYGGPIVFEFPGCGKSLNVPDASDNYSNDNGIYFCGTKNKPAESNGTRASVFAPVGCTTNAVILRRK